MGDYYTDFGILLGTSSSIAYYKAFFIIDLFQKIKAKRLLVRIPCSSEEEPNEFYLEISRLDPTHINCKPASKWVDFFNHLGYNHIFKLNMSTIYNSNFLLPSNLGDSINISSSNDKG